MLQREFVLGVSAASSVCKYHGLGNSFRRFEKLFRKGLHICS